MSEDDDSQEHWSLYLIDTYILLKVYIYTYNCSIIITVRSWLFRMGAIYVV